MAKKILKVAGWINIVLGGLMLLFSLLLTRISFISFLGIIGLVFSGLRLTFGGLFIYISQKDDEGFIKERRAVLGLSILAFLTGHIISFILGLIAYVDMKSKISTQDIKHEMTEEEKAQKRLRNLLALGCGLVLLAGIIFAMTTWETLSGGYKTISLIFATLIFFVMSNLAEKKFKLKSSAITYYILANAFLVFSLVSAGYFNIFGEWFSLTGEGSALYSAGLWFLVSVLSYFAYLKYDIKNIFYVINFSAVTGLIFFLEFFGFGQDIILFVTITILAIFALIPSKGEITKRLNNFANVFLPITSLILFSNITLLNQGDRVLFNLLSFGVAFISIYYLAIVNKNIFFEVFAPIFTIGTAFVISTFSVTDDKIVFLQFILITIIVYFIGYFKKDEKALFASTSIVSDFALLYVLMDSVRVGFSYYAIAAGILLLGTSIIVSLSKNFGQYHFEKILEPVKVVLLSYAIYSLTYKFDYTEETLFLALIGFVLAVVCTFRRDLIKKLYFIGAVVTALCAMLDSSVSFSPISQGLNVISFAILLLVAFKSKDKKFLRCKELIYGLSLLALALLSLNTFSHFGLKIIGIILLTVIYSILFVASNKNDIFRCFTIVALLIPYVIILPISVWNDNINYILYSLPWLALIFVYTRGFLVSVNLKTVNLIEIITLSIWYFAVSSQIALEVAIFIGIISFIALLIGYKNEKWTSLYYTGVAFLIVNTLFQLREFWTSIPIWAYILVAGLILIGIVTYKEYAKVNGEEKAEKVEAEIVDEPKIGVEKQPIDKRNIIAGSLLYLIVIPILLEIISRT